MVSNDDNYKIRAVKHQVCIIKALKSYHLATKRWFISKLAETKHIV